MDAVRRAGSHAATIMATASVLNAAPIERIQRADAKQNRFFRPRSSESEHESNPEADGSDASRIGKHKQRSRLSCGVKSHSNADLAAALRDTKGQESVAAAIVKSN